MKKMFILLNILFWSFASIAAVLPGNAGTPASKVPASGLTHFSTLKMKEVEKLVGRKLSLKEKIAVKIFQWKIRKGWQGKPEKKMDKGKAALVFGIAGLVFLLIPVPGLAALGSLICIILALANGYSAKKADPNDKNAKTGIILGWIGVGLFIVALIIVIAVLSSFSLGFG